MEMTGQNRTALVLRLQQDRIARGWADEVRDAAPQTEIDDLIAAAARASVSQRLSGPARCAAGQALAILQAFKAEPTMPELPKLVARYEPTEKERRKERAERKRRTREDREAGRAAERNAGVLEGVAEIQIARALMEQGAEQDDYARLALQHVAHGFDLPLEAVEVMARRLGDGVLADEDDDDHRLRFLLLQVTCSRMRGPSKTLAHSYCDWWETRGKMRWTKPMLATIENLLGEARNDGRIL
jgi:phage gp46-like protein